MGMNTRQSGGRLKPRQPANTCAPGSGRDGGTAHACQSAERAGRRAVETAPKGLRPRSPPARTRFLLPVAPSAVGMERRDGAAFPLFYAFEL
jgi:hypothetical protein